MVESLLNDAEQGVKLALAAGANDCIVSASDSCSTSVDYRDGKLEKVQQSAHRGLSLRLYVDGKYSSHNTCDLRPEQLKRFIEDAVALTHYLEPDPYRVIPDPALFANQPKDDLQLVDSEVLDLSRDQCLDWLKSMDAATHADKRVISSTSSVYHGRNMSAMASSNGFRGTRESTSAGYGSEVTLDEGNGKRPEAYRYVSKNHLSDLIPPERTAAECLERARARLGSTKLPTVRTMMVVDHEAAPHLLHYVMNALQAGALQQKRSFLADKKDQRIGSELLTVTDDPLLRRGMGSRHFDGEGISARRMPVIENGVLKNYYVDTYYGKKLGWQPTTGGASNLVIKPGTKSEQELIGDAGDGIFVDGWLGGNSDGTTGDFSFGIKGHRIEKGKKTAPVSEMNITGNFLSLLQSLIAVGNDPNPWSTYMTPTLVFKDVQFSGE